MRLEADVQDQDSGFSYLPSQCADALADVQAAVENKLSAVSNYVDKWLQFQSLWDLRPEQVYDDLQDDLARWLQLIQEILGDRNTFDTSEVSINFGHIVVNYEQVQLKVNSRFDQWQQDILLKFAILLGSRMNQVHSEIEQARMNLEGQALEASTQQAVQFITIVQQCKRKVKFWANDIEMFRQGETTLKRQRHQFPKDWLYMGRISDQWDKLLDVLERKSRIVEDQSDALRAKIEAEEKIVLQSIADIREQWSNEKPVSGSIPPDEAEVTLKTFESKMTRLRNDAEGVARAKEALDLPAAPFLKKFRISGPFGRTSR
jgi:dynein heavy chain 1